MIMLTLNSLLKKRKSAIVLVFKHLLVSVCCASIDLTIFGLAFHLLEVGLTQAYILGFCFATCVGYLGHSFFTFRLGEAYLKNALLFTIQASISFLLGYYLLILFVGLGLPVMLAKALQMSVTFFFNVSVGKFITFKKR